MLNPRLMAWDEPIQECDDLLTGRHYTFASKRMYDYCVSSRQPKQMVILNDDGYEAVVNSGLSRRKMRNLAREWPPARIHYENWKRPLLFARIRPDFSFLADGNHRYAWAWENGVAIATAYVCDRDIWEQFLVGKP